MGPGTGRGSGLRPGSRLQLGGRWVACLGGTQEQTDRWLWGRVVGCPPGRLGPGAHRHSSPAGVTPLISRRETEAAVCFSQHQGGLAELASAIRHQAHLTPPRSSRPWSCGGQGEGPCLGPQVAWWGSFCSPAVCPPLVTPGHPGLDSGSPRGCPEVSPAVCSSASQPSPGDPGQARQETNTQALRLMARTLGDLSCPQDWPRCRYTGAHKCSAYVETEAQRGFTTCPRAHSQAGLTPNIPSHSSSGVGWVLGRWAPGPPARSPPPWGYRATGADLLLRHYLSSPANPAGRAPPDFAVRGLRSASSWLA